jgi:hypothetical protein
MDVAPEWHEDWTRTQCSGETRRCAGGDQACANAAQKDGYVFISNYTLCRKEQVTHTPGTATYTSIGAGAVGLIVAGVVVWRLTRRRVTRPAA